MTDKQRPCDICGAGTLTRTERFEEVEHHGSSGRVRAYSSICDHCGIDVADAHDNLLTRREWIKFKKQADDVPLGGDIAAMRKLHRLNQEQAGRLFGGGKVAFSKYENDEVIPDEAMIGLLKLAIAYPDTVYRLAAVKGMKYKSIDYKSMIPYRQGQVTYGSGSLPQEISIPARFVAMAKESIDIQERPQWTMQ